MSSLQLSQICWAFRKGRYFKKLSDIVKMIYLSEILSFYVYRNRTMPRLNTPFYTQHRMPAPTGAKSGNTITKAETEAIRKKLGNMASAMFTTVVKLYVSPGGSSWEDTGVWGAVSLVIDRSSCEGGSGTSLIKHMRFILIGEFCNLMSLLSLFERERLANYDPRLGVLRGSFIVSLRRICCMYDVRVLCMCVFVVCVYLCMYVSKRGCLFVCVTRACLSACSCVR